MLLQQIIVTMFWDVRLPEFIAGTNAIASDETPRGPSSLGAAWVGIVTHPYEHLVRRWNWKSGLTSTILRGSIFFSTNLSAGRNAALAALLTELGYRALLSGGIGSVTETLRKCRPEWAAALTVSVILPAFSHVVEFTIHSLRHTPHIKTSVTVSIGFSVLTVLFNFYAMRRGVLLVGSERQSLGKDLAVMPRIVLGFIVAGPLALRKLVRSVLR
jgi:hypothetical protein